ncbi:ABC transporter ATP-binding protein [Luteococcus sp. OSA5]|uniref:ABC transporter ATP-binding protein n=1 Tax=Luteococcus sp. OSA5 TaxID=3401630 RepID=UPI003B437FB4
MIEFDDVSIRHAGAKTPTLAGASFVIPDGDLCLVVGRTGTGKSTLLGAINGLVPHFSGSHLAGDVRVEGRSTRTHRPRDLAEAVGYVGQNPLAGFVTDRVEDEVAYGMEQLGLSPSAMRKRVEETLDIMGIAGLRRRALTQLSGGQQQRVAIAAVLAAQPRVVVLDEPTSALDPTAAQDVLSAITTLVYEVGLTVVLAEHRLERVMHVADSVLWLPGDGSVEHGPAGQVLARADVVPPLSALARRLGWSEVPLSVRDARRRVQRERVTVSAASASRELVVAGGAEVARVEQLGVSYGDVQAVADVSLSLRAGTITAVMGRNGAGKSSLLWALQGAAASTGQIDVQGIDPREVAAQRAREVVSLVPQEAVDLLYLPTVAQECAQADRETDSTAGTTAAILRELGADLDPERHPRDLSEGQRLALVLAIQLAARPVLVLLDEPTRGLDYAMKDQLRRILTRLAAGGSCVLVSTHDVEFAAAATDRTIVMADGDVVADGPTREVCTSSPTFAPQVSKVFHPSDVLTVDELMVSTPAATEVARV